MIRSRCRVSRMPLALSLSPRSVIQASLPGGRDHSQGPAQPICLPSVLGGCYFFLDGGPHQQRTSQRSAPASGLPSEVTGRSDTRTYPVKPGDNRLAVSYFATQGALLQSVTVSGRPGTGRIGAERGHPVYVVDVELPRGTSRTIVLHLNEPAGTSPPIVLRQPLVRPLTVTLKDAVCS